ncbi:uncharacterized protein N7483_000370 [Penicillium malachiteum]|uniref:uncharacterized protein n=1 Tax=Penicillium malachiteum TaxID=1324776 RepID=UPI002548E3F8|nr:uncharacterized protein N7483_000370 [Penicillium malachiteum]KAJ5735245.1 hypothetical protein N7483_000370 [Penicillium malachiteum]
MSTAPSASPSGVSAPLTVDNENNRSGLIVVLTGFYLVLILASVAARAFSLWHRRSVQTDDYLFSFLAIIAIIQGVVVFVSVHFGWGNLAGAKTDGMFKAAYTADILSILVLGLSKVTACVFYDKLFSPVFSQWQAITALDIFIEILLSCYSVSAIYSVRISKCKKLMVFSALESRVLLIALSAIRLYYVNKQLESTHPILIGSFATVATEIYLALSIVCLVTAFVKSFIDVYVDENGISYTEGASGSRSRSKSAKLHSANIFSNVGLSRTSTTVQGVGGWEREEDPIIDPAEGGSGLQIFKTVHLTMRDESIELLDQARSRF